jgi:hypothetical protein
MRRHFLAGISETLGQVAIFASHAPNREKEL